MSDAERGDGLTTGSVLHRRLARRVWKADPVVRLFYYPEDDAYLLAKDPGVSHFEVVSASGAGAP